MVYSMTAFAESCTQCQSGIFYWEIRSVNHRYLEASFRLPEGWYEIESLLRQKIRESLKRGKVDCYLKYEPVVENRTPFALNESVLKELAAVGDTLSRYFHNVAAISPIDVLKWPGVVQTSSQDRETERNSVEKGFLVALSALKQARLREGTALQQGIEKILLSVSQHLHAIEKRLPDVITLQREKVLNKLSELNQTFDENRLEQELLYWAQKIDISEEVERLKVHIKEVSQLLKKEESIGKKLDFLMQELNREVNTIGAKSSDLLVTQAVVELKVYIEQMREQIQNIE